MNVHYTGRHAELSEAEQAKAQRKFEKIHRILSEQRELEAHVVLSKQKLRVEAEVTLNALSHTLVVNAAGADAAEALSAALSKLEAQAAKNKHKLVDSRRVERQRGEPAPVVRAALAAEPGGFEESDGDLPFDGIVRANGPEPKPMSLEGARILLDERNRDQITYRDMDTGALCVLLRRRDGRLELVEASA